MVGEEPDVIKLGASIQSIAAEEFTQRPADPRGRLLETIEELATQYQLDAVELFLDGMFLFPEIVDRSLFEDIARLQQRLGIAMTAHLPYAWVDLSSANERMRAASVQTMIDAVEMTAPIDIWSYAIHATGPFGNEVSPNVAKPEQDIWVMLMLRSIERSLSDLRSRLPDAPLAVETMEGFPFEWQAPIVKQLDLGVCCDLAHLTVRGIDPEPFIEQWLPKICQFHVHGVREQQIGVNLRLRRDHHPLGGPGELVDTQRILALLDAKGFEGPVILENLTRADLDLSVPTLRQAAGRI